MSDAARPRSILALLARLSVVRPRLALGVLGLALLLMLAGLRTCPEPELRVATFNIRNFPEHPRQIEGAFETIAALEVPIVAVQEITDPRAFTLAAAQHLGPQWRAEFGPRVRGDRLLLPGVLYDRTRYQLDYARRHHQTRLENTGRPTLEVRLFSREGGPALRVFVVHLKSGGEHAATRSAQLHRLAPVVRRAVRSRDEVVVLGDFNATGEADLPSLARFARDTGLHWATDELECTAYWRPRKRVSEDDGRTCSGSALDHVFTSKPAREAVAHGPCESVGCEPGDSCPIYYDNVSDHCPVSAAF